MFLVFALTLGFGSRKGIWIVKELSVGASDGRLTAVRCKRSWTMNECCSRSRPSINT